MAHEFIVALSLIAAASQPPMDDAVSARIPPPGTPETKYCLRMDPLPGSRIETIWCKTRDEWAELEINLDEEWAENGVRVIA